MSNLRILICHPEARITEKLQSMIHTSHPAARIYAVHDLSRAYHLTEHKNPDCLVMDAALAMTDDFALLSSLLKILKVGCVVVSNTKQIERHHGNGHYPQCSLDQGPEQFGAAIDHAVEDHAKPAATHPQESYQSFHRHSLIAIGSSTGGIDALAKVLKHFPKHAPPTLIVQHTGANFAPSLIRLLNTATQAQVKAAADGELLQNGTIYFAPDNRVHLCLSRTNQKAVSLVEHDPVSGHCPSIDMLFQSAVPRAPHVVAALLTGMGRDGAEGLKALRDRGAHTIGQDKKTCVVYGMPRVAKEIGAVTSQLPIDDIGPALLRASLEKAHI